MASWRITLAGVCLVMAAALVASLQAASRSDQTLAAQAHDLPAHVDSREAAVAHMRALKQLYPDIIVTCGSDAGEGVDTGSSQSKFSQQPVFGIVVTVLFCSAMLAALVAFLYLNYVACCKRGPAPK